jgi:hypothetical protein
MGGKLFATQFRKISIGHFKIYRDPIYLKSFYSRRVNLKLFATQLINIIKIVNGPFYNYIIFKFIATQFIFKICYTDFFF